ncbi:nucleoside phosphorylase [Skermanella mucosa]|uniref:phosphorylase family protein n=1 Tax=Skermanella mucosa TaxID=1789672 RepID=UPI00192C11E9|nr:nucleoside phosphorylase [Skermanella mucosa]UEM23028.1 nucleoside phosphorylase [Skermanella mucosa]
MTFGIVVGMEAEARIARRSGLPVALAGGAPRLLAEGADGLISFGIAGGLAPGLAPGTLVVASEVILEGGDRLPAGLPPGYAVPKAALRAPVAEAAMIVAGIGAKRDLHRRTGAAAVDLESGQVARLCADAGVPFAVIRAIADPAERELPPAALVGMGPGGRVALGAVLASVAARPGQIPALVRVALDTRKAFRALAAVRLG